MRTSALGCIATLMGLAVPVESMAADSTGSSTFFAGAEFDNRDSRRVDLGLTLRSGGGTSLSLVGSRTDTAAETLDLESTYAFGKVTHDFGRIGLGAGVRHMEDEGLTETLGLLGTAFLDVGQARLTATIESRKTDLAEAPFEASGADLGLDDVTTATGTATCNVDSLGYGVGFELTQQGWSLYASGMAFDYSAYKCAVEVTSTSGGTTGGGPAGPGRAPFGIARPAVVTQLAAGTMRPLGGYSSTLVPREAALLESSFMIGASFAVGARSTLGVELYHDTEQFAPVDSSTLLGYVIFGLTESLSLEFNLGTREADGFDSATFAGLRLSATIGR
jgi:hypothetical protein